MVSMSVEYVGGLHCELVHGPSQSKIETDAPKDNNGKGEKFSPTDLVGAALGSCILTTMALVAERDGVSIKGAKVTVEKEMSSEPPRRIVRLNVAMQMPAGIPQNYREKLEAIAHKCPVQKSIHPDIETPVRFVYADG